MVDWQNICVGMACRIQYEINCDRKILIDESISRFFLAEIVQSQVAGNIEFEYNHSDLPGDKRVDIIVRSPNAKNIDIAIEHKYVRVSGSSNRNWMSEVIGDVLRIEKLSAEMAQKCERIIVVSGEITEMRRGIWERSNNRRPRQRVVSALLQERLNGISHQRASVEINISNVLAEFKVLLKNAARDFSTSLPRKYAIQLVGYCQIQKGEIECAVWRVSRSLGKRGTFDLNKI